MLNLHDLKYLLIREEGSHLLIIQIAWINLFVL